MALATLVTDKLIFLCLSALSLGFKLRLMTRQTLSRGLSFLIILVGVFFVLSGSC
ncbi:hypothetical protein HM1_2784 [Heliomicrobium modesticaldum Ice1]|uniref:Uncharacterized protein n=1 Tax=Heliobacterium modesticaldum (strain ATCC 51547 / Ice1) TaxID=498761 RepID=B0TCC5_HELMI|nr:hypothetical protein [Heliomicrobium modesticaldum]ABZ85313.1 hypothetical protein HM1_2784 [Heliomicrobium modesticaldum Ice1]